jgi:hypothetical protein
MDPKRLRDHGLLLPCPLVQCGTCEHKWEFAALMPHVDPPTMMLLVETITNFAKVLVRIDEEHRKGPPAPAPTPMPPKPKPAHTRKISLDDRRQEVIRRFAEVNGMTVEALQEMGPLADLRELFPSLNAELVALEAATDVVGEGGGAGGEATGGGEGAPNPPGTPGAGGAGQGPDRVQAIVKDLVENLQLFKEACPRCHQVGGCVRRGGGLGRAYGVWCAGGRWQLMTDYDACDALICDVCGAGFCALVSGGIALPLTIRA